MANAQVYLVGHRSVETAQVVVSKLKDKELGLNSVAHIQVSLQTKHTRFAHLCGRNLRSL